MVILIITVHTQMQVDSVVSGTNSLLIPDFSSSTRGERHNSYYADPTNVWRILWFLRSQFISAGQDPNRLTAAAMVENSMPQRQKLNSLPLWSYLNFSTDSFSKSQDHLFQAWHHQHSSPISCVRVYYDNGDRHILCTWA